MVLPEGIVTLSVAVGMPAGVQLAPLFQAVETLPFHVLNGLITDTLADAMELHNPNLAVVCDAEQIIYCEIDKKNKNKVIYESGSLENENINKRVTDILEGTMEAFRIRDTRYQ